MSSNQNTENLTCSYDSNDVYEISVECVNDIMCKYDIMCLMTLEPIHKKGRACPVCVPTR